jgi:8-oxo-dGTP pyrophosphatase MutT (NUDIX family)
MATTQDSIRQAAAIPIRAGRVCLVTSRSGKRWVVPKGRLTSGNSAAQTALQEAWEEGGLLGVLQPEPFGSYLYEKSGHQYHVTVFLMHVTETAAEWPECGLRRRCWLPPANAQQCVSQPGLRELLRLVMENASSLPNATGVQFEQAAGLFLASTGQ